MDSVETWKYLGKLHASLSGRCFVGVLLVLG